MDDIVNKVAEKTGVGADTVRKVLTTAADFIKAKLPPQFAAQVDGFLSGGGQAGGGGGGPGDIAGKIGGMFGGKS
jgi:hypothetical protein